MFGFAQEKPGSNRDLLLLINPVLTFQERDAMLKLPVCG